jgi:hypothetical protein
MGVTVTIHQPNLFPWLGFFDKMSQADIFILLDTVQYTKQGLENRVRINGINHSQWLTIPVINKGRYQQLTGDVEIAYFTNWQEEHLKTFKHFYQRSPNYQLYQGAIAGLYQTQPKYLLDFTIPTIVWIKEIMGIKTHLIRASELGVTGKSSHLLCNLVKAVGGNIYLSGPSGKNYLDESVFNQQDITVNYHQFTPVSYPQLSPQFIPGLSTLDYLFMVGSSLN